MKILGLSQIDSGCGFHRVVCPLGFMDDIKGHVTNMPTPDILEQQWDIVLFNRFSPFDNDWTEPKQHLGAKIVMDLDDDWELPTTHINYIDYLHLKPRLINNIREADLVTVTNQRIADKVYPLNHNVEIMVNGLPFGLHQFTLDRDTSSRVRILWAGSITHEADIALLRGPLRRMDHMADDIEMVIGGYNDINQRSAKIWDRMLTTFTNGRKLPFRILRGTTPDKYMEMYRHGDIMVIPLEASPWHAAKSNLKILEAASKKIPVIVSHVEPYLHDTDAPVLWVKNQSEWYQHIKTLVYDKEKREDLGQQLYDWALSKYNLLDINKRRRASFERLIKTQAHL